jgi:hypothetical protein
VSLPSFSPLLVINHALACRNAGAALRIAEVALVLLSPCSFTLVLNVIQQQDGVDRPTRSCHQPGNREQFEKPKLGTKAIH